jgi:hypothetical protein
MDYHNCGPQSSQHLSLTPLAIIWADAVAKEAEQEF